MSILDTIVIQFGSESDSSFNNIEIDPYHPENLDNEGNLKNNFSAQQTEPIWLRFQLGLGYGIGPIILTAGSSYTYSNIEHNCLQERVFIETNKDIEEKEKPYNLNWIPRANITLQNFKGRTSEFYKDGERGIVLNDPPVICDIAYEFIGYSIQVVPPRFSSMNFLDEETNWPIGVVINVEKT